MQPERSLVCTLFEGHYHYGVAALVNSLYTNGFRGNVFAGYRGTLPFWAAGAEKNKTLDWSGATSMAVAGDFQIHFLPVEEGVHLSNYKPAFMLALRQQTDLGIFYFDPDIVIKSDWSFFEDWIKHGVAVVQEIVSNNFSPYHPKRMQWIPVIERSGRKVERQMHHILNSGFCGVSIENCEFLEVWNDILNTAINYFDYQPMYFIKNKKQSELFVAGDQELMNIAAMCCKSVISDVGPEGMDFIHGGWLMSHATGNEKPWKLNYLKKALGGGKISLAEKNYWKYANGPLITYKPLTFKLKKLSIKTASFINRFYVRS